VLKNNILVGDAITDDVDLLVVDVAVRSEAHLRMEWVKEVRHKLVVGRDGFEDLGECPF